MMKERIIVALDVDSVDSAVNHATRLASCVGLFKVGSTLFTSAGPDVVRAIQMVKGGVFLDLKYHDIPQTVKDASLAATKLGVRMFNVHCAGGLTMMKAALEGVKQGMNETYLPAAPLCLGVTVLTSQKYDDFEREGIAPELHEDAPERVRKVWLDTLVINRARLAQDAGLDGVIASAREAKIIRESCGSDFLIVTPGVRSPGRETHDQARVTTPEEAMAAGADYIVSGRQILKAEDPEEEAKRIAKEMMVGYFSQLEGTAQTAV